ncbi:MAG: hypothetical protein ACRDDZ_06065 [Marinifilaceae bacterium]
MNDIKTFNVTRMFEYIRILWQTMRMNRLILILMAIYVGWQLLSFGQQRFLLMSSFSVSPPLSLNNLIIAIIVFIAIFMSRLNPVQARTFYLSIPISNTERYVATWLFTLVIWGGIVFIVINALGYLFQYYYCLMGNVDFVMANPFSIFLSSVMEQEQQGNVTTKIISWNFSTTSVYSLFIAHSLFFMGGYLFRRNSVLKTLLCALLCVLLFTVFMGRWIMPLLTQDNVGDIVDKSINIIEVMSKIMMLLPFVFYAVAYWRLRRQEI